MDLGIFERAEKQILRMAPPEFINETEWKQISDSAFNPPDCSTSEGSACFDTEYWTAHATVRAAAESYVETVAATGAKSERNRFFTMNEDFGHSRFIDIECHSRALISFHFARHLQLAVRSLPERYLIALHHDLFFFDDRFGGLFDAFIDPDRIRVFSECSYSTAQFQTS